MAASAPAASGVSNAQARTVFLNSALRRTTPVAPNQVPALGSQLSFTLPKSGIPRGCWVLVDLPITIGTASCTESAKGPFPTITNVQYTDANGLTRINASAYALYLLQLGKRRSFDPSAVFPFVASGTNIGVIGTQYNTQPQIVSNSNVNAFLWRIPTGTGNDNLQFSFYVPIALDRNDSRGSLLATVPGGNHTLTLTLNTAMVATSGVDTPYTSSTGTCVLNSPTTSAIQVLYEYWDPVADPRFKSQQFPDGVVIPFGDLQLVHEFRSYTDTSGLAASTTKKIFLPAGRNYERVICATTENGALNSSHLQAVQFIYDSSNIVFNETIAAHNTKMLYDMGRVLPEGVAPYFDFSDRDWDASSYGSLEVDILTTSSFSPTNSYVEVALDSLYAQGQSAI
jgi:hypothetical protein